MSTSNTTTRTYTGSPMAIESTIARIGKLNERAAKKGFDNVIHYFVGDVYQVNISDDHDLFQRFVDRQDITVEKRLPLIAGWNFVGKIDYALGHDHVILMGDDNMPEKYRNTHTCEHCNTTRNRNAMFVLKSQQGDYKAVGSTCLQDFIGIEVGVLLSTAFSDFDDEFEGGYGQESQSYDVKGLIAATHRIADAIGYTSGKQAYENGGVSTADMVRSYLGLDKFYREIGAIDQTDIDFAAMVIKHFENKVAGDNAYLINLKTMLDAGKVPFKFIGTVVSAYGSYKRDIDRENSKVAYAAGFIGNVKDKIIAKVSIENIKPIESYYGVTYLITMRSESNHSVVWFASNKPDFDVNDSVTIKATVKDCKAYNGVDQTYITRAKVVE
jgi:hypothetical protein